MGNTPEREPRGASNKEFFATKNIRKSGKKEKSASVGKSVNVERPLKVRLPQRISEHFG
jgi:hypothetical protein